MAMGANPSVSGVSTAHADVLIGGIYVRIDPNAPFDPKAPIDDLPNFIPGADLAGNNLPLPIPADGTKEIQTLTLHLLTDPGITGTVTYHLNNVSHFPGIAMNWPVQTPAVGADLDFGPGAASSDAFKLSTPAIPLNAQTGDTPTKLYVYDYAAQGQLAATVTTAKQVYTIDVLLPQDEDGNGLPDAGWKTPAGTIDSKTIAAAADDTDALSPAANAPAQLGDGFSAFEEYRGFVINGTFERLDPKTRDLFIDADPQIDQTFINAHLPYRLHYIIPGESAGTDLPRFANRIIKRTAPIMDANRTSIPGAQTAGQRGIRLVYTSDPLLYPTQVDSKDPQLLDYPVWQFGINGITWQDGMNIQPFDDTQAVHFATLSANEIRFVEVLARSQTNDTLHISTAAYAASAQPIYNDETGQPVPDCATVQFTAPCDHYFWGSGAISNTIAPQVFPTGDPKPTRFILHSRLTYAGDFYTKYAHACGSTIRTEISQADYAYVRSLVVAHEVGHNLALDHSALCSDIMFGIGGFMPDNTPYPIDYRSYEAGSMRTHK
jgi:hypothetical protein